jgi:hypothetical protein
MATAKAPAPHLPSPQHPAKRPNLVTMPNTRTGSQLGTHSGGSKASWKPSLKATAYLRGTLPGRSLAFFSARRVGNNWGLAIMCPHCDERPPREIRPWNRWRWLAAHIVVKHQKK